jgi:hypothetical protein
VIRRKGQEREQKQKQEHEGKKKRFEVMIYSIGETSKSTGRQSTGVLGGILTGAITGR